MDQQSYLGRDQGEPVRDYRDRTEGGGGLVLDGDRCLRIPVMIRYFSHCSDQIPAKGSLREKSLTDAQSEDWGRDSMAARLWVDSQQPGSGEDRK